MRKESNCVHKIHPGHIDLHVKVELWRVDDWADKVETTLRWKEKVHPPFATPSSPIDLPSHHLSEAAIDQSIDKIHIYTQVDADNIVANDDSLHSLTSSVATSTHLSRATDALGTRNLHTTQTLDITAATLHDRITREGGSEMMIIMAAIESQVKKADTTSGQRQFHEQLLCQINLSRDGRLEVAPGLSKEERDYFDGDSEFFVSPENMEARQRHGCKLKPFSFKSLDGTYFRYTIQVISAIDNWEQLEDKSLLRIDEEYRLLSDRRGVSLSRVNDLRADQQSLPQEEQCLHLEIQSASDFDTEEGIFVKYHISLPCQWEVEALHAKRMGNEICSTKEGTGRARTIFEGKTTPSFAMMHIGRGNSRSLASLVGMLFIFSFASLQIGIQNGALFSVLIIVVVDEILGTNSCVKYQKPVVLIGHHISMLKIPSVETAKDSDEALTGFLDMKIQVYAKRSDLIVSLLGQTSILIPTTIDNQRIEVQTYRPIIFNGISETMYRLKEHYLGSTMKEIQHSLSKFSPKDNTVVTEPSGTLVLRVQSISNSVFCPHFVQPNADDEGPILKESVDEILSRIRRSKRARAMDNCSESVQLTSRTKEVLDRVRRASRTAA